MRPKIGDILEIPAAGGLAYALFTHKAKLDGDLIRVWSHLYEERPEAFEDLVREPPSFSCFFPLSHSISQGFVRIATNIDIPPDLASFPVFRGGLVGTGGRVSTWWRWDGVNEWKIGELTEETKGYPIRGTWSFGMLKLRIEKNWHAAGADF